MENSLTLDELYERVAVLVEKLNEVSFDNKVLEFAFDRVCTLFAEVNPNISIGDLRIEALEAARERASEADDLDESEELCELMEESEC